MEDTDAKWPVVAAGWIGHEREPIVVIDDFAPDPERLRDLAARQELGRIGDYYPGVRAPAPADYFDSIAPVLHGVLREFFRHRGGIRLLRAVYSLATTPPGELALAQRIPHVDAYDDRQIAIVHHLGRVDLGGTAFFRHRSTGFETVDARREAHFHASLAEDFARHGEPAPGYIGDESPIFERIHRVPPRFNRALVYRGKLLHCADLAETADLPEDPLQGRLTIASFLAPTAN